MILYLYEICMNSRRLSKFIQVYLQYSDQIQESNFYHLNYKVAVDDDGFGSYSGIITKLCSKMSVIICGVILKRAW